MPSLRYLCMLSLMSVLCALETLAQADSDATTDGDGASSSPTTPPTAPRFRPKVWYLSNIKLGFGIELPIDYVTLTVGLISSVILYRGLFVSGPKASCTASHILVDNHQDATRKKLEQLKKEIGSDAAKFAEMAAAHSTCPSKAKGGMLGTFPAGAMVPAFDKCCFNPETPEQTAVGPVQTHFGYHLIFIHERTLPAK